MLQMFSFESNKAPPMIISSFVLATKYSLLSIHTYTQECSVFLFEKRIADKLHKPRRREMVTELLKASVKQLERFRHPKVSSSLK